jgi:hypothetical protein
MKPDVKKAASTAGKFATGFGGLVGGVMLMKQIPAIPKAPAVVSNTLPGLAGMVVAAVVAGKTQNEYLKYAAIGVGIAGVASVILKNFGDKLPGFVKDNTSLSGVRGLRYVRNYGDYNPAFQTSQGAAMSGLRGANPYKLSGANPYKLQGAYSLNQ